MAAPVKSDRRNGDLARIHVLKKQLGQDDETYRAMLLRVAGVRSSADLDGPGRGKVLREMERLSGSTEGADRRRARFLRITQDAPRNVSEDRKAMIGKVEALLADAQRPWSYAHSMAKRMFNVTRVDWLPPADLHKLVSAMQIDANRRAKRSAKEAARGSR